MRVDPVTIFFLRRNCADIVLAISQIATGEILNRHIYNTAMNSINKENMPGLNVWEAVKAMDFKRRVWMNKFVRRSGQYTHLHNAFFNQKILGLEYRFNLRLFNNRRRANFPMWSSWSQRISGTRADMGLPTRCLPRSRSSQACLRLSEDGGALGEDETAGEV